jgi:hypothetical protein
MKPAVEIHFSLSSLSKVVNVRVLLARRTLSAAGGNLCDVGVVESAGLTLFAIRRGIQAVGELDGGSPFHEGGTGLEVLTDVGGFDVLERLRNVNLHLGRCGGGTRGVRGTGIIADGRHGNSEVGVIDSKPGVGEEPG